MPAPQKKGCQAIGRLRGEWTSKIHAFVDALGNPSALAVIPPKPNRVVQRSYDRHLYKDRNLVERFFNRIQQFRRIATRYEKLVSSSLSFPNLFCTYIWIVRLLTEPREVENNACIGYSKTCG
ncbi:hypothetical protein C7W93_11930 [Glaciimonas sp. PCH181]|nr:hypothetical protein C7W93_11930 [Glaciimonas sp. PCH181]